MALSDICSISINPISNKFNTDKKEALAIEAEDAKQAGAVGYTYMARVLTQATLPHKNPRTDIFRRTNGLLTISIADVNNFGLPYGSIPRLLLAWLTTEEVLKNNRKVMLGDSLTQFMCELSRVPTGGRWGSITRLKSQLTRLFSCAIGYRVDDDSGVHLSQSSISDGAHFWWIRKPKPSVFL